MTPEAEFQALRAEYESPQRFGELLFAEVANVCRWVSARYPPSIYADPNTSWTPDALDDLVQDVVVGSLLSDGQLDYSMSEANDLQHFRALLARQVRHTLAKRRKRTVVDNLLRRAQVLLDAPPFQRVASNPARYALEDGSWEDRPPNDDELHRAALAVHAVPRLRHRSGERAPAVYTEAALRAVLLGTLRATSTSVSISDFGKIFEKLLTAWLPTSLGEVDEESAVDEHGLTPAQEHEVGEIVDRVVATLTSEDRRILAQKLAGVSDSEVAAQLGVSRPTAIKRKNEVWAVIQRECEDLEEAVRHAVAEQLVQRVVAEPIP